MDDMEAILNWHGFCVKKGERDMYWVTENGVNPMPGACCFRNFDQAKKGIAALMIAERIAPDHVGEVFWNLMELAR